jgi:hypothetical protein
MDYARHLAENPPIGSSVVEAVCKTPVKPRLCDVVMRWKHQGAKTLPNWRTLFLE